MPNRFANPWSSGSEGGPPLAAAEVRREQREAELQALQRQLASTTEELARCRMKLRTTNEDLAAAESRRRNEFLAVMSHELKLPLNLISVNAQLLAALPEAQDLPAVVRAAKTIQRAVLSQSRMIDELLDLSRVNDGELTIDRLPVLLGEALRPAVTWAIAEARLRSVRLLVEGLDEPVEIEGDPIRIEQIAWNLLSNAIKFSPVAGEIQVTLATQGHEAVFSVRDSGRGIDRQFLPRVFGPFHQADPSTRRGEGGMGIGLAMVKSLAELHGGRVEAESAGLGQGATFRVVLPLRRGSEFSASGRSSPAGAPVGLAGRSVLLVDDTEDALETFAFLLQHEGCTVVTATRARDALAIAEAQDFDLLISDVGMPQMDGYQLVEALRARPRTATLPAIALTGHGRAEDMQRAFVAGFQAHVHKPVDFDHMKTVIATVLGDRPGSGAAGAPIATMPSHIDSKE